MIRFIPRPWNCTPPLSGRLGLKHYPLSLAIATSSRAEGEGMRLFWIDPLPGGVPGVFPFHRSHDLSMSDHKNILALPAALSGFRLTHPADPIRVHARSLGSTGRAYLPSPKRWHIQYSRLLKSVELPNRGSQEVSAINAKTPVVLAGTNRGFVGILGRRLLIR